MKYYVFKNKFIDSRLIVGKYQYTDYNNNTYILDENDKIVSFNDVREASKFEIYNNIRFKKFELKDYVAFNKLTNSDVIMAIIELRENDCDIVNLFTKEIFTVSYTSIRPARVDEIKSNQRKVLYNKQMYLDYLNPYMIFSLYRFNQIGSDENYQFLKSINLMYNVNTLSKDGERLFHDIDFDYLKKNIFDLTQVDKETTYITCDKQGMVLEFKTDENTVPTYDDEKNVWFIIENDSNKVISVNKIKGFIDPTNEKTIIKIGG